MPDATPTLAAAFVFNVQAQLLLLHLDRQPDAWAPPLVEVTASDPALEAYKIAAQVCGFDLEPQGHLPFFAQDDDTVAGFVFLAMGLADRPPQDQRARWVDFKEVRQLPNLLLGPSIYAQAYDVLAHPTVDFVRARDRPETLSPAQLAEAHDWLHRLGREESEVHAAIIAEMDRRHLRHAEVPEENPEASEGEIRKDFAPRTKELEAFLRQLPQQLTLVPEWGTISGSQVYAKDRQPNDCDWIFKEPYPNQGFLLKLARLTKDKLGVPAHFSFESAGPNWPYSGIYDLVAVRRDAPQVQDVGEPEFHEFYKAELPFQTAEFQLARPFKQYKCAGEFDPGEEHALWSGWAQKELAHNPILVQEKFDGMRLMLHKEADGAVHVFSETGRAREAVFPDLAALCRAIPAKDFAMDCEFVAQAEGAPAPRWTMTWMIVGKEPAPVSVKIHAHDLMWLNGQRLAERPYQTRLAALQKLLPQPRTEGKLWIGAAPTRIIQDQASFQNGLQWAKKEPGSEGAMFKGAGFIYHGGTLPDVVKYKNVTEIDVAVIGWKKNPAPKPSGVKWTAAEAKAHLKDQQEASRTYIFRAAVANGNKLLPLESDKRLTAKDLTLAWNEAKQVWEGTDDPALWHQCPGFEPRRAGEYAYANTYALALDTPPYCGMILTVAPMQFRPFRKDDGSTGYAWMFPKVKNTKERGSRPGELAHILAKFGFQDQRVQKSAVDSARQGIMVAFPVPPDVGTKLQAGVRRLLPQAHFLEPEEMHLTLAFLGDVDDAAFSSAALVSAVKGFALGHAPLAGKISGVGRFTGDGEEAAIYASFDAPGLTDFYEALWGTLHEAGMTPDRTHGFTPHITLCYVPVKQKRMPADVPEVELSFSQLVVSWGQEWTRIPLSPALAHHELGTEADPQADLSKATELALLKGDHSLEQGHLQRQETPDWIFQRLNNIYHFTLDAAADRRNAKVPRYFSQAQDSLQQPWTGRVWLNPPYHDLKPWVQKAYESAQAGATVVCLLPANTDTAWWHEYVSKADVFLLRGRLHFNGKHNSAPFGSAVAVFRKGVSPAMHLVDWRPTDQALAKKRDPFLDVPPEGTEHRYVIQHHYRGQSAHADLRLSVGDHLVGWTVMDLMPGEIKAPVETVAQAKAQDRRAENWKLDWTRGVIRERTIRSGVTRRGNLRAAEKAEEIPSQWLSVEGVTEKPDPGDPVPTGATRNFPGVFSIIDRGEVEFGAQKPWFHEYFLNGQKLHGRWVVRMLERDTSVAKAGALPPGKEEASSRTPLYWVVMQPLDQTPYVLSPDAVKKGWLPPSGASALPAKIRAQVPPRLQYWKLAGEAAAAARKELAENFEELYGPGLKQSLVPLDVQEEVDALL